MPAGDSLFCFCQTGHIQSVDDTVTNEIEKPVQELKGFAKADLTDSVFLNVFPNKNSTSDEVLLNDYVDIVNPVIGAGWHGHTFPGPVLPYSMIQLNPDDLFYSSPYT